jgi:hypothetical protein
MHPLGDSGEELPEARQPEGVRTILLRYFLCSSHYNLRGLNGLQVPETSLDVHGTS